MPMSVNYEKKTAANIEELKERMKIFHDSEDYNLQRILDTSEKDVLSLVGEDAKNDLRTIELIYERSRYVYYDSLEFFYDNFQEQILNISLAYADLGGDDDGD